MEQCRSIFRSRKPLGRCLHVLQQGGDLYLKAIRMRPDFVAAYIYQGEILMERGQLDEAESLYQQAVQLEPLKADIHYDLGIVAYKKQQKPKALEHFDRAVEIDPKHKLALYNSALCIQQSGNVARRKDAMKRLEKVIEIDPESEMSYSILGMLAVDDDDNPAAFQYYQKALEIIPSSRHTLFNTTQLYLKEKLPLQAKPYLENLLQHHPNDTKSMHLLGNIMLNSLQDFVRSQQLFQQIVDLEPSNVHAQHNLCIIPVKKGLFKEGEHCLSDVLQRAPNAEFVRASRDILRKKIKDRAAAERSTAQGEKVSDSDPGVG